MGATMKADVLRVDDNGADIWLELASEKCVLRWRPGILEDKVFLDGKLADTRRSFLTHRDRTFAFAIRDGEEKRKVLFIVDRATWGNRSEDWMNPHTMMGGSSVRGVLVAVEGKTLAATGSFDPTEPQRLGQRLRTFLDDLGLSGPHAS
jgi:hypothetical protein